MPTKPFLNVPPPPPPPLMRIADPVVRFAVLRLPLGRGFCHLGDQNWPFVAWAQLVATVKAGLPFQTIVSPWPTFWVSAWGRRQGRGGAGF